VTRAYVIKSLSSEEQMSDACHLFSAGIMVLCRATLFLIERAG